MWADHLRYDANRSARKPQHREQVRQIDEPFRLAAFLGRERVALILAIQ